MPLRRAVLALVCVAVAVLAACEREPEPPAAPRPLEPSWRQVSLPHPPGEVARVIVREAVTCDGTWYVVGGVADKSGGTRPAVWAGDGQTWRPLATAPKSYYGHRAVLYAAGCHGAGLVAIGAKSGGAHGNPRINTWYLAPSGVMTEADEPYFELFGGNDAVSATRVSGGPRGWLISGSRTSGAAVWQSPDGREFQLKQRLPELRTDERGGTLAVDLRATPDGWLLVGVIRRPQRPDADPIAWTSPDGESWKRAEPKATGEHEEFQRLTSAGSTFYAGGVRGKRFAAWRWDGAAWADPVLFGEHDAIGVARVASMAGGEGLFAAVSDGSGYHLWWSSDANAWQPVAFPGAAVSAQGDTAVGVAMAARRVLVLADDGAAGRVWLADL